MSRAQRPPSGPLANRLGEPPELAFPDGWQYSGAWQRAQTADARLGPTADDAHYDVFLERESGAWGDKHRVLFAIQDSALRAECDCKAFVHREWCAHVAHLWWRWSRDQLGVRDLDTDETYLSPPWWLTVDDAEVGHA